MINRSIDIWLLKSLSSYIISLFRNNGWNLCQKKGVSDNFYFKCRIYFHFMIIRYFSNVLCTFYIYFLYTLSFVKQMIVAEYSVCWLAVARRRYFILYLSRTKIVFRRIWCTGHHFLHCYWRKSRDNFYPMIN